MPIHLGQFGSLHLPRGAGSKHRHHHNATHKYEALSASQMIAACANWHICNDNHAYANGGLLSACVAFVKCARVRMRGLCVCACVCVVRMC